MGRKNFIIGPFVDYSGNPILEPRKGFTSKGIYNPTVMKEGKDFYMLFRAEAGVLSFYRPLNLMPGKSTEDDAPIHH